MRVDTVLQSWSGSFGGAGNHGNDPLFLRAPFDGGDGWGDDPDTVAVDEGANDDFGDLRLRLGSAAIDTGDNEAVPLDVNTDVAGDRRIMDGVVDMGAYETPPFAAAYGGRYLAITPRLYPGTQYALLITSPDFPCLSKTVDVFGHLDDANSPWSTTPDEWGTVLVHDPDIVPGATYEVQALGSTPWSSTVVTERWGDTAGEFVDGQWNEPDGVINITSDAVACIERFGNRPTAPPLTWCDLEPERPDGVINILDIVYILDAFRDLPYPFRRPCE